jgi:hypothetical protein
MKDAESVQAVTIPSDPRNGLRVLGVIWLQIMFQW